MWARPRLFLWMRIAGQSAREPARPSAAYDPIEQTQGRCWSARATRMVKMLPGVFRTKRMRWHVTRWQVPGETRAMLTKPEHGCAARSATGSTIKKPRACGRGSTRTTAEPSFSRAFWSEIGRPYLIRFSQESALGGQNRRHSTALGRTLSLAFSSLVNLFGIAHSQFRSRDT
jgi:hypothetical protein